MQVCLRGRSEMVQIWRPPWLGSAALRSHSIRRPPSLLGPAVLPHPGGSASGWVLRLVLGAVLPSRLHYLHGYLPNLHIKARTRRAATARTDNVERIRPRWTPRISTTKARTRWADPVGRTRSRWTPRRSGCC